MIEYWKTFCHVLIHLIKKPLWLLVLISLSMMSLVYGNHVWKLPVALVDLDHSNMSRSLARKLNSMSRLEIIHYSVEMDTRKDLANKKIFAVIIIPKDTEKNILKGEDISIQASGDATNRLPNGLIQKDILSVYEDTIFEYNKSLAMKSNWSSKDFDSFFQPINPTLIDLYNAGVSFSAIIFPGLVSMILQQSLLVACVTITLGLKREDGDLMLFREFLGGVSATFPIWIILSFVVYIILPNVLGYRQTASIMEVLVISIPFI
ncbi:TPA: ABC transporter permease, partial [Yersinia enterocolitica]|nr:ABC transporter permease [Yersinia enterocolitica]